MMLLEKIYINKLLLIFNEKYTTLLLHNSIVGIWNTIYCDSHMGSSTVTQNIAIQLVL